ncbi:hypothetical protein Scep_012629 [Stephania cephalantha]|uniref:Uncharacterized protein n=1 Tax=Stephania cephalantha TaxID=152367 RepID=A0AAP0JFA6_9MAGN
MEARMDRIEERLKRISAIEVSIGEFRSEVRMMFRGLAQRFDELLLHYGIVSTSIDGIKAPNLAATKWNPISGDPHPVAIEVFPTVRAPNLVHKQSNQTALLPQIHHNSLVIDPSVSPLFLSISSSITSDPLVTATKSSFGFCGSLGRNCFASIKPPPWPPPLLFLLPLIFEVSSIPYSACLNDCVSEDAATMITLLQGENHGDRMGRGTIPYVCAFQRFLVHELYGFHFWPPDYSRDVWAIFHFMLLTYLSVSRFNTHLKALCLSSTSGSTICCVRQCLSLVLSVFDGLQFGAVFMGVIDRLAYGDLIVGHVVEHVGDLCCAHRIPYYEPSFATSFRLWVSSSPHAKGQNNTTGSWGSSWGLQVGLDCGVYVSSVLQFPFMYLFLSTLRTRWMF